MHVCGATIILLAISIGVLVYSSIQVSKYTGENYTSDELCRRNKFIIMIAVGAVGIVLCSLRLGYLNWARRIFKGNMSISSAVKHIRSKAGILGALDYAKKHGWKIDNGSAGVPIEDILNNNLSYTNVRFPEMSAFVDYANKTLSIQTGEPKTVRI